MVVTATASFEDYHMAFPEDTDYPTNGTKAVRSSPIAELSSSTLFTLMLQFIVGIIALIYALPGITFAIIAFTIISWTLPLSSYYVYLIIWMLLSIVGVFQIHAGYKLYKMIPETIGSAIRFGICAIILFGIDVVISAYENILLPYPEVIMYLVANILLVVLLLSESVRKELDAPDTDQSQYWIHSG